jgi:Zn-dependent oligopeptidase
VHQFSEKRVSLEHRVRTGHRVATREETVGLTVSQKTVEKKTALSKGEDNFSVPDTVQRARRNLHHVARPQCRQHTFAANLQAQPAGKAQSFYR